MASDTRVKRRHPWSLMNEEELTCKLQRLGLILNRPEPALICQQCKYALQPSGKRVSTHLAEKHAFPASERKELVSYIDSLHLPDPNLLSGRRNGSAPHPNLLVSRGAACKYCTFHSKSSKLIQQHIRRQHWKTDHSLHWVRDGVVSHVSMQSWTQNGSRTYWAVDITPEVFAHVNKEMTTQSPHRKRWLETLHEEERKRIKQGNKTCNALDTGMHDETFVGSWMRRTDWTALFSGVDRRLLFRLTEAPANDSLALVYGVFDDMHLQSSAEDERRIRMIGVAMDEFFERCEDTVSHTGHSTRCWLRSHLADRPYKAPFQLPFRPSTRSRYRGLWRRLLYFCFRLYRLGPTVCRSILRYELTEEQRSFLDKVWIDPYWTARLSADYCNDRVEGHDELRPSTRCSSITSGTSTSSWSAESASSGTNARDSGSGMVPTGSCKASEANVRTISGPVEDEGFIDLGLDDWPVCENSDDSLRSSPQRATKTLQDRTGNEPVWTCDQDLDDTEHVRVADIVGKLSYSLCCEEFLDGKSSTTMLVYFCAVLGISNDGSTFDRPRNYTPKLSAMIHSARLVCLEAALPRHHHFHVGWNARPQIGQLEKLNRVRERFMCLGSQAPLGELLSLRSYGRAFSRTDGPSFRVRWSDDGETISWADGKLCLREFRSLAQRSMDSGNALLREMMYGIRPNFDLSRLHDDMSVTKQGYSFVQDPRNNLAIKYLELSTQACLDSENGLMSGESWNTNAVRHYLDQDHELLKQLGLIMYLSGGQAPRSTELFSIECENGPATSRGLYIHDGALCYVTRHSKSRRTTNEEFQVARYLPPCASQVLVAYLVYIRPFVAMLRRTCVGQDDTRRLLFRCPYRSDAPWKADVLTKSLKAHAQHICKTDIGIQVYRQLSIAITEKHVKQISRPFHLNDDRSAHADMEVAFAWQSGHRPNQRGTSYGIDGAFPDSLQPALLRVYRWTSDQWHQFINLESSERSQETGVARPGKNCRFGKQQSKRKVMTTDGEYVDPSQKRRFPWSRPSELSQSPRPGLDFACEDIEEIHLRGSCASALSYLQSLSRASLSAVREVHIASGLLMADDDDNISYVDNLWGYLVTHTRLRSISIAVPDDIIASAKKNQGQYEWFMWKLHKYSVHSFLTARLDELRFVHKGEHPDEGMSIYEWFNVANYIEEMLIPDNTVLFGIRSKYWNEYYASLDCPEDERAFRRRKARQAALQDIDRQWQQAGLSIKLEKDWSEGCGPVLVVKRLTFRG